MSNTVSPEKSVGSSGTGTIDMKLEVVVIPVADADRAKQFYGSLGWRLDIDFEAAGGEYRVIQFTPPGSGCSVIFGRNVTLATPGSAQGHYLIVSDIEAARAELIRRGVEISQPFHDTGGVFHHADSRCQVGGVNPQRKSYASFAAFSDPDGNSWLLQEITARLSADLKVGDSRFTDEVVRAVHGTAALDAATPR
jgi:predicted enzyme related to lactoylglutathione lyase